MKFLIADDHELFLKGLELLLKDYDQATSIVTASDYTQLFDIINKDTDFDLILTDLAMPGAKWTEAIKKIYAQVPNIPIVILSAVFEPEIIKETIETGVAGYITKTTSNKDILDAISLVLAGGVYIPKELLEKSSDKSLDLLKNNVLTPRQTDIIRLIAKGMPNKNIAYELGLTEGTIKIYVTNILKNLNVNNRTAAVIEAKRLEII